MAELIDILERVTRSLDRHELQYVIVGGVAAILRGKARTTMDVDIIVEDDLAKIFLFLNTLMEEGFDPSLDQARMGFSTGGNVSIFDNRSILRLDLKIARGREDLEVLNNAVIEKIEGLKIRLA
ncbi:MAG: DUF6036 family nucleotidyltransferase, partial [Promethearchaeota archaeon]